MNRAALAGVAAITLVLALRPWANDGLTYWSVWQSGVYAIRWPEYGAFVYSPAFAQAIWPATLPPFGVFWPLLVGVQAFALLAVLGPRWTLALLVIPWWPYHGWHNPVFATLADGNIDILLGSAMAVVLRYPAAWAFVLLTKVTPGVGLLWFAVRREWRSLGIALGVTAGITAVSFLLAPSLWFEWVGAIRQAGSPSALEPLSIPLLVRLPIAALLVAWGARKDRIWTVGLGAMLALPQLGYGSFVVGIIPLCQRFREHGLLDVRVGRGARWLRPVHHEV